MLGLRLRPSGRVRWRGRRSPADEQAYAARREPVPRTAFKGLRQRTLGKREKSASREHSRSVAVGGMHDHYVRAPATVHDIERLRDDERRRHDLRCGGQTDEREHDRPGPAERALEPCSM
jgi:hypothetical protein